MVKNLPANAGDLKGTGSVPESARSPGGNGNPLQYSCQENSMDRGTWQASPWGRKELVMTSDLARTHSEVKVKVAQSCPTLCNPMDCTAAAAKSLQSCPTLCDPIDGSPPVSPVPGILQARTLEWVAISFSRGSSQSRDQTQAGLLHCRQILHQLSHKGKPKNTGVSSPCTHKSEKAMATHPSTLAWKIPWT